jgi:hypothetical protein
VKMKKNMKVKAVAAAKAGKQFLLHLHFWQ